MFFTRVAAILCVTGLLAGIFADTAFVLAARLLGGFGISATPRGWMVLGLIGWMVVFFVGWAIAYRFHLLPYQLGRSK